MSVKLKEKKRLPMGPMSRVRQMVKKVIPRMNRLLRHHILFCVAQGNPEDAVIMASLTDGNIAVLADMFYQGVLESADKDAFEFVIQNLIAIYVQKHTPEVARVFNDDRTPAQRVEALHSHMLTFVPRNITNAVVNIKVKGAKALEVDFAPVLEDDTNTEEE